MDGIEATALIREWEAEHGKGNGVPIIALTANAVSGMKEMFLEKGFNGFIAKPIDVSKLDDMLDRWIPKEKKITGNGEWGVGSRDRKDPNISNNTFYSPLPTPYSLLHDIPGIDAKYGISMTGGSEAVYRTVLATFCNDVQQRLAFLQKAPEKASMNDFITQVHALKGAAASIGAAELSAYAARIEEAGSTGNIAFIKESLNEFVCLLSEMVNKINATLKSDKIFLSLLSELKTALKSQDNSAIARIMNDLNKKSLDAKTKDTLEKISDAVMMEIYDSAIKIINTLLG